jgi:beta-phosphoglucomutase family hydrolase
VDLGLPTTIRACLFDLDGVLTATSEVHATAWKETFDAFLQRRARDTDSAFVPFDRVADFVHCMNGKSREDGIRAFLAARGIELPEGAPEDGPDAQSVRGLTRRKGEAFLRALSAGQVRAYPGSVHYLRAVRSRKLATAVVSSSRNCRAVLEAAQLTSWLDVVIDGVMRDREHWPGKPAPDTFLAGARALRVDPAHAAMFEDALAGVEAGRAGGFGCVVGVDRLGQATELKRHGADVVVRDLAELLGAP